MTSIDWLSVQGIRSFNPNERQTIKFFKPLTIILGQNGAGKTTIIECLKNATTGELPPNSNRGKSFVHDPKVDGTTEVKAQIRLQFRAANKKQMVTIRSFSLTQNKKTATFKQLDATIQTRKDNGEIASHSYKVGEMDKLIPECMGVSKAILENVIFCHQEDVNWPLSESSVLKKKFDDIFASTRYTKALDVISKTRKEQTSQIKEFQKDLAVAEAHRDQVHKLKKEAETENFKVEELKNQIAELEKKIAELNVDIEKYDSVAATIQKYNQELQHLEGLKQGVINHAKELHDTMANEFEESDEELQSLRDNFVSELAGLKKQREDLENKISDLNRQKTDMTNSLNKLQTSLGGLTSLKQSHERRVQELSQDISNLAQRYQISGYERLNDQLILKFVQDLGEKLNSLKHEYQELKKKHQGEESVHSTKLSTVQAKLNNLGSNIAKSKRRLEDLKSQDVSYDAKIARIDVSEEQMQQLKDTTEQLENQLTEKKKEINLDAIDSQIRSIEAEITETNKLVKKLGSEMQAREAEKVHALRIQDLKQQQEKTESTIENLLNDAKAQFSGLIGSQTIDADSFSSVVATIMREKKNEVNKMTTSLQTVERTVSTLKGKIDLFNEQIKKLEIQISEKEKKISDNCPNDRTLTELIQETEEKVEELRGDVSMTEALKMCYENFIRHAKNRHACPVCDRGLEHSELDTFENLQRSKLDQAPKHLEKKRNELHKYQELLRRFSSLTPITKEIEQLKTVEIPRVRAEKEKFAQEFQDNSEKMDEYVEELASLKTAEEQAAKMITFDNQIRVQVQSLKQIKQGIATEEAKLDKLNTGINQSFEELRIQQETAQNKGEQLNASLGQKRQEYRENQNLLNSLNVQKEKAKDQLRDKQLKYQALVQLKEQKKKNMQDIATLEAEITELASSSPALEKEINDLKQQLNSIRATHNSTQSQMESQIASYQKDISGIDSSVKEIRRYINENKEDQLQDVQNKLDKTQIRLKQVSDQIEQLTKEKDEKSELLSRQAEVERTIEDNIKYRAKKRDQEKYEKQIADIKQKLANTVGKNEFDERDINRKKQRKQKLLMEMSQLSGMRTTHKSRILKIKDDLETNPNYEDIEQKYRATLIKLKTTELAHSDLEKYYQALDKALMKYHAMKMAEINEMIKELWAKTYRGQDIDTIEIRADHEGTTTTRRQYNYRVVMKKGDVALDMRGRCSAGQKVLACLIIRLALAEAFCIDCGVLALDEPTTNLDIDTIGSLAESLQLIITERRKQANFQLVVITHDEEFVNKLGQGKFIDHYYRVSKDPSTGYSLIERQNFRDA